MTGQTVRHHHEHDNDSLHDHVHEHHHSHEHHHEPEDLRHDHDHCHRPDRKGGPVLVIRPYSGLSGDIFVAGLSALTGIDGPQFDQMLKDLNLEKLIGRVSLTERMVNHVLGAALAVDLPEEHEHRSLNDIVSFFNRAAIDEAARDLAIKAFRLLAEAEGAVHGHAPEDVHFHEVGAMDSIMDIGLTAVLLTRLAADRLVCGPLPVCDGVIRCQHGLMVSPAPAVLKLLSGVPVVSLASRGETVTPTGLALLKAAGAEFGLWPPITIERQTLAYGTRYFEGVPNGVLFAFGSGHALGYDKRQIASCE